MLTSTTACHCLVGQVFQGNGRRADAGVVEEQVQAAEPFPGGGEEVGHAVGLADVAGHCQHTAGSVAGHGYGLLQKLGAATGQGHGVTLGGQCQGGAAANAGPGAGYDGHLAVEAVGLVLHGFTFSFGFVYESANGGRMLTKGFVARNRQLEGPPLRIWLLYRPSTRPWT